MAKKKDFGNLMVPGSAPGGAGAEVPADTLWRQLVELDEEHSRLLLAGISDPRQSAALQSSLPWIAAALQGLRADVLADCGRLDALSAVRPVLSAAAVLVLRGAPYFPMIHFTTSVSREDFYEQTAGISLVLFPLPSHVFPEHTNETAPTRVGGPGPSGYLRHVGQRISRRR